MSDGIGDGALRGRSSAWPWAVGIAGGVAGAAWLVRELAPGPGARVIRELFDRDAARTAAEAESLRPSDVVVVEGVQYRKGDEGALLDVHRPATAEGPLPTIVWVHGGGFVSGSRQDVSVFCSLLAQRGFAVVSLDYRLAPRAAYPAPVVDVTAALAHLVANAEQLGIDPHRLVLAGDSAGAQVASQIATIVTSPEYAALVGVAPVIAPGSLRAVVLFCGFYDLAEFAERGRVAPIRFLRWGVGTILHAYTGVRSPSREQLDLMSAAVHATAAFPPTFVSGGDDDPLTDVHSRTFAAHLAGLGVPVTTLFFPEGTGLGHEYQRDLSREEARRALDEVAAFVAARTA
jgi:acetyl esterase/lipase